MEKSRKSKLLLLAFFGLILGILGISKSDHANTIPGLRQERFALSSLSNNENICSPESNTGNGVSLFLSCAGFLE